MVGEDGTSNLDYGELVRLDGAELAKVLIDFPARAGTGKQVQESGVYGRLLTISCSVQAARGGAGDEGSGEGPPTRSRNYLAGRACCCARTGSDDALHGDRLARGARRGLLEGLGAAEGRIGRWIRKEESDR